MDLIPPIEADLLVREAYEAQANHPEPWTAIGFKIESSGRYHTKLFYGAPLHLNGDSAGAKSRMLSVGQ
ncbi:MAG: hypothetical protein ACK50S_01125 [bacterium]